MRPRAPKTDEDLPLWLTGAAMIGGFVALAWLERRHPLRTHQQEPQARHDARNIAVAGLSAAVVHFAEKPLTDRLTRLVRRRRVGLLPWLGLPVLADAILGSLLLDCTLFHWHVLAHKVPLLWRFHRVHHADLDMGTSTGVRFHFGEMLVSVLFRGAQVIAFGVTRRTLSIWKTLLLLEVMFHHSNIEVPDRIERGLSKFIVTPRLHAIHHSLVPEEVNSNWSSGLTLWDRLHGTFRRHAQQPDERLDLGVPELRAGGDVALPKLIAMPFRRQQGDVPVARDSPLR